MFSIKKKLIVTRVLQPPVVTLTGHSQKIFKILLLHHATLINPPQFVPPSLIDMFLLMRQQMQILKIQIQVHQKYPILISPCPVLSH